MFNLRGVVEFFVFDPLDRNVIYAQANGLWRSQDGGTTWALIYPKPSAVKSIKMSSDHSDEDLIAEPNPLGNITATGIDPGDSKTLHVAVADAKKTRFALFVSRDGGRFGRSRGLAGTGQQTLGQSPLTDWHRVLLIAGCISLKRRVIPAFKKIPPPSAGNLQTSPWASRQTADR